MLRKIVISASLMLAMLLGATTATAEEGTGFNIFFAPGYHWFDEGAIDDTGSINVGIGYKFSKHWGVEASYFDLRDTDTNIPGVEVDGEGYRLDGQYFFTERNGYLPYVAFGVGELDLDASAGGSTISEDETFVNLGVGVKKYITPHLALRGDARVLKYTGESETDAAVFFGLDYFFGKRGKAAPVALAAAPKDSDGDGVIDENDLCPNTPAGVKVDSGGCALDGDGDLVPDYKDQCPNTPRGARVDVNGCQYVISETVSVELEVLFDTNKAIVKPDFFAEIKRVADFMILFPKTSAKIEGHTDSRGEAQYNLGLSQRRADAVRDVLVKEHKVDSNRLVSVGSGEDVPRATNDTAEGRKSNRRVVAIIATEVKKKAK